MLKFICFIAKLYSEQSPKKNYFVVIWFTGPYNLSQKRQRLTDVYVAYLSSAPNFVKYVDKEHAEILCWQLMHLFDNYNKVLSHKGFYYHMDLQVAPVSQQDVLNAILPWKNVSA